jgi:hypothetical protein
MPSTVAGYSGTPLAKKLGIRAAGRIALLAAPEDLPALLEPLPPDVVFQPQADARADLVHLFVTERDELARQLAVLHCTLRSDAALWISWPKKASRVPSTVTEDTIRELALPLGFVDIKVCAVSAVWSGLKLVVRRELR